MPIDGEIPLAPLEKLRLGRRDWMTEIMVHYSREWRLRTDRNCQLGLVLVCQNRLRNGGR